MYDTVLSPQRVLSPEYIPFPKPAPGPQPPIAPQGVTVLDGSNLEEAFTNLLLTLQSTEGNALVIDALSVTNPHHIVQMCRRLGLDYRDYLDRILIERPFTAYQMTSVIGELLPKWIKEDNIRVIMGVGLFSLLQDPDLGDLYRQWGKGLIMRRLKVATEHFGLTTYLLPIQGRSHLYFQNTTGFGK
jgi:hypothetical protein